MDSDPKAHNQPLTDSEKLCEHHCSLGEADLLAYF